MDQTRDGLTLHADSMQYGLKHMLPECFVSVKLEPHEEGPCHDTHQHSHEQSTSSPKVSSHSNFIPSHAEEYPKETRGNSHMSNRASQQVHSQVQLPSDTMQQAQTINQSRSSLVASQGNQINHGPEASHVPQANSSVNRPTNQQPSQASGSHQFPHPRPSEITWLSHPYVDQNTPHFHTHQMQYVPNDAGLLSTLPGTQDGARLVKQNPESQGGSSAVGCRGDSNAGNIASVPGSDSGDSNAFISYVLSPQRGVPSSGIFLFDASRGLSSQSTQIQSTNREDGSQIDVQSSRSIDETVKESSSDSSNICETPKLGDRHLVSRSCQTIVTMSQIQDAPLLSDTKIIIMGASAPAPEPEDSKDKVFAGVDGEESEEASSMDSESECENLKQVTRLSSDIPEFRNQTNFSHKHGRQNRSSSCNGNSHQSNGVEVISDTLVSRGGSGPPGHCTSMSRGTNVLGSDNFSFMENDRPFRCETCGRTYTSQQALVNHERYHRGERPYECEVCHKAFATNSHLVTHRRTHTGERPFQCQLCQRCFADRSAFVKHERTHGPNGAIVKRYKCDECGSCFVDSCGLKKHMRIHTGERPYVCNVCTKTFSTSSTFVAHKRIHTGERPYKCESCDKMFVTKSHLLTHRRTHTGEKPFTCTICNRCFADGSSFRRHERLHTGENRHICMQCGRGFPLESSLEKHKQTHVQTGSFSYVYEGRNELNCLTAQQSCDMDTHRSARISVPHTSESSVPSNCVDLSREMSGEVNRNNLCAVASREIDGDNQGDHSTVMVTAREVA